MLSGWWFQPFWTILVSWDDYSQYMEKSKMFQTTNQLWVYSMAMQQEPINWRYVYHRSGLFFRAKFQGISPEFIWPEIWYIPPFEDPFFFPLMYGEVIIFFPSTIFEEPQRVDPQDWRFVPRLGEHIFLRQTHLDRSWLCATNYRRSHWIWLLYIQG